MMRDSGGSYLQVPDFEKFGELFDKKRFYSEGLEIIVDDIVEGIARRKAVTGEICRRLSLRRSCANCTTIS